MTPPRVAIPAELAGVRGRYGEIRLVECGVWIYRGGWILLAQFENEEDAASYMAMLK